MALYYGYVQYIIPVDESQEDRKDRQEILGSSPKDKYLALEAIRAYHNVIIIKNLPKKIQNGLIRYLSLTS